VSTVALLVAVVGLAGAWLLGWPVWRSSRDRAVRDTNTERYLAWRGRGSERPPTSEGWTAEERSRMLMAGVLGAIGVVALAIFFVAS
jgi:hypothetical protein